MKKLFQFLKVRPLSIFLGCIEFGVFVYIYNTVSVEVAWTYVFSVSSLFCIGNFVDAVRQIRAQRRAGINSTVEVVTYNALQQEGIRAVMSVLWLLAGIAAIIGVDSAFAVWVLFGGAYAFRINALLTVHLRRQIEEMEQERDTL